jgi:hypothetical protein
MKSRKWRWIEKEKRKHARRKKDIRPAGVGCRQKK